MRIRYTKKTVLSFLKAITGQHKPKFLFLQTLTFKRQLPESTVISRLKKFLDWIHSRFEMGSIFVKEANANGKIHMHVVFLFYDTKLPCSPSNLERELRCDAFELWNKINNDELVHVANKLDQHDPVKLGPTYFFEKTKIQLFDENCDRNTQFYKGHWWGKRNKLLLDANYSEPCHEEVLNEYTKHIGERVARRQKRHSKKFTNKDIPKMQRIVKDYSIWFSKWKNWEEFKKDKAKKPCSDDEFIDFLHQYPVKKRYCSDFFSFLGNEGPLPTDSSASCDFDSYTGLSLALDDEPRLRNNQWKQLIS